MATTEFGDPIATGRTADIFSWGDGTVLKLYHTWVPRSDVETERHNTLVARDAGVSVPRVDDMVSLGDRTGLVFERIDGPTLFQCIQADPHSIEDKARYLAELHSKLHEIRIGDRLPSIRERLIERISRCGELAPSERVTVLDHIDRLPEGDRLCHGDFHPANVMMAPGSAVIIDWVDANSGNAVSDVARTSILLLGYLENSVSNEAERHAISVFHQVYLEHYFAIAPQARREYDQWFLLMAAARLTEGIENQQKWLLAQVRKRLNGI